MHALKTTRVPNPHRTVDRVTRILEEVLYNPGLGLADLVRAMDTPKSSLHGFMRGLMAKGWLYEDNHRFYLGPAVYGLTLASGNVRAGQVTQADLLTLHDRTGAAVFLGVQAGDDLIYVADAGSDHIVGFEARTSIRRRLLVTAGGKALLATRSEADLDAYLRRRLPEEGPLVEAFLSECSGIRKKRIAINVREGGSRFAIATAIPNRDGQPSATVTIVGRSRELQPRQRELEALLIDSVDAWAWRTDVAREAI
ncbi:IclR family transcriptional regulator [Cupriavidus alkaliphilus]|uniref:IclR family transcriptional regulator n=1 Tax=Cupriavidus alkaliphilus TaxID=942866 RepID=UPI00161F7089|nr:helix-turn-helix domain-containing protein [Cupriavidus alkaliphilus]MBB3014112.1 DNA-binding IclR family transcriptional regulator [Cupriavidus alkaliphilus]